LEVLRPQRDSYRGADMFCRRILSFFRFSGSKAQSPKITVKGPKVAKKIRWHRKENDLKKQNRGLPERGVQKVNEDPLWSQNFHKRPPNHRVEPCMPKGLSDDPPLATKMEQWHNMLRTLARNARTGIPQFILVNSSLSMIDWMMSLCQR
jgi:hypothetical protein